MEKKSLKKIEKIIKVFFQKMTFDVGLAIKAEEENILRVAVTMDEAQILVGDQERILFDLQRILGKIIRKQLSEEIYLEIDLNEYRQNKEIYLKKLAQGLADEVVVNKEEKVLSPMSSYNRRIIHLELASRDDVKTESIGEGENRRIVIRPA